VGQVFGDPDALRQFYVARLERFLRLVDATSPRVQPELNELARRAAVTAYCDCHDWGAGDDAQRLMDHFMGFESVVGR
jgi:hypothetical protein